MDRGAWLATVHGVTKSQTRLSDFTFTFIYKIINMDLLYCTRNSTQCSIKTYFGKNLKLYMYIHTYIYAQLNHFAEP